MDKVVVSVAEAMSGIKDGSTVLVAGFGMLGQPCALVTGLIETGAKDLTIVSNGAGSTPGRGLSLLFELGRVRKLICSFPRSGGCDAFARLYRAGKAELEVVPQGTLAERVRAAGAGIGGFFTPTAAGTILGEGKETRVINGVPQVFEMPLPGDVALVQAWDADRLGNLYYRGTGRNFNPVMAAAGKLTIVQACHILEPGQIAPEIIATPGIFVDRLVQVDEVQDF